MRFLIIAVVAAAAFLLAPFSTPASAHSGVSLKSALTIDFSAAKMKKAKVEYMRSAAGPEPKAKKHKTKKTKTKKK
jgi:hypothetical protein